MDQRRRQIESCFSNKQRLKVIYFRLYNLLGTFQRIINSIFRELLYEEVLVNYMDNFVILAKTKKELEERTI